MRQVRHIFEVGKLYFKGDSYLHNFFTIGDFPIQFSIYTSCRIHHVFSAWGACADSSSVYRLNSVTHSLSTLIQFSFRIYVSEYCSSRKSCCVVFCLDRALFLSTQVIEAFISIKVTGTRNKHELLNDCYFSFFSFRRVANLSLIVIRLQV